MISHEKILSHRDLASIAKDNKNLQTVPNRQLVAAGIETQFVLS